MLSYLIIGGYIETRLQYQMYNTEAIVNATHRIMADVTAWEHARSVLWLDPLLEINLPANKPPVFAELGVGRIGWRLPLYVYTDYDSFASPVEVGQNLRVNEQIHITVTRLDRHDDWVWALATRALNAYLEQDNFLKGV